MVAYKLTIGKASIFVILDSLTGFLGISLATSGIPLICETDLGSHFELVAFLICLLCWRGGNDTGLVQPCELISFFIGDVLLHNWWSSGIWVYSDVLGSHTSGHLWTGLLRHGDFNDWWLIAVVGFCSDAMMSSKTLCSSWYAWGSDSWLLCSSHTVTNVGPMLIKFFCSFCFSLTTNWNCICDTLYSSLSYVAMCWRMFKLTLSLVFSRVFCFDFFCFVWESDMFLCLSAYT